MIGIVDTDITTETSTSKVLKINFGALWWKILNYIWITPTDEVSVGYSNFEINQKGMV